MADKFLKKDKVGELIQSVISGGGRFVAPVVDARQVVYAEVSAPEPIKYDHVIPDNSYKEWVFPQTEVIADFTIKGGDVEIASREVNAVETFVFGARPCEAVSLASLRSVFTWEGFTDEFYTKREDAMVVATIACTRADEECFCTTVGLSPESTDGADLYLLETPGDDGGYMVTVLTERGKAFVEKHAAAFDDKAPKGAEPIELVVPEKVEGVDLERVSARLDERSHYEDPVWTELARKCIGCGACTFSCPTCHCFDITDEGLAYAGERRKNWDACQFDHFTLHASGHNPRDAQFKRWRNRFMCKFNYYPKKFGTTGCVGCGRCIRVCPVRLDITEAMEALSR